MLAKVLKGTEECRLNCLTGRPPKFARSAFKQIELMSSRLAVPAAPAPFRMNHEAKCLAADHINAHRAQISKPSTWQGRPPWIVGAFSIPADRRSLQFQSRPVPLLENVEPLWRWVHQPVPLRKQSPKRPFRLELSLAALFSPKK